MFSILSLPNQIEKVPDRLFLSQSGTILSRGATLFYQTGSIQKTKSRFSKEPGKSATNHVQSHLIRNKFDIIPL